LKIKGLVKADGLCGVVYVFFFEDDVGELVEMIRIIMILSIDKDDLEF